MPYEAQLAVYEAAHTLHAACFYHMYAAWKGRSLTITSFGYLKKEIEALAMRKPATLIKNLRAWEDRNSVIDKASGPVSFG